VRRRSQHKSPWAIWFTVGILALSFGLRLWFWPANHEIRSPDEVGYMSGGLTLLEGISPGYGMGPGGVYFWFGWLFTIAKAAFKILSGGAAGVGSLMHALESVVFETYRNFVGLRTAYLLLNAVTWSLALGLFSYAAFRKLGAAKTAAVVSFIVLSPLFVREGVHATPYPLAWSFVILSWCFLYLLTDVPHRFRWAAWFLGLAIGTRVECVILLPQFFWFYFEQERRRGSYREPLKLIALVGATFFIISPWYSSLLFHNLRYIYTIAILNEGWEPKTAADLYEMFSDELVIPLLVATWVLLLLKLRSQPSASRGVQILFAAYYVGALLKPSPHSFHNSAPAVLGLVGLLIPILDDLKVGGWIVGVAVVNAAAFLWVVPSQRGGIVYHTIQDLSAQWVNQHGVPGTKVYVSNSVEVPLPTREASNRLWQELVGLEAVHKKLDKGIHRLSLSVEEDARLFSEAHLTQERGNRRRWYLLGGAESSLPRFDVYLYSVSTVFGLSAEQAEVAFMKTGGILIWYGTPLTALGEPAYTYIGGGALGSVEIYCRDGCR
jgi:hypothetical protein